MTSHVWRFPSCRDRLLAVATFCRNGIITGTAKRVTSGNSSGTQPDTLCGAMLFECVEHILRAAWRIPAMWREPRADITLVPTDTTADHRAHIVSIRDHCRSRLTRSCSLLAVTLASLGRTTISISGNPARARNDSRTTLFNRFRSTALFAFFFATAIPSRAHPASLRQNSSVQYRSADRSFFWNT